MAIVCDDVEALHNYAEGVMARADHHAPNVNEIFLVLLGCVIWRIKPGSFEAKQYDGKMANIFWWTSKATGRQYCCAYNHHNQEIEIRDCNIRGQVMHKFTNNTLTSQMKSIFATL